MKLYEVGGSIRDSLIKRRTNDFDYVLECSSFFELEKYVTAHSKRIFLKREDFGVIRYLDLNGKACDISMAIKSRDKDGVIAGSILEDLELRDFTINAMAKDAENGTLLDPFNGRRDIEDKVIRTVRPVAEVMNDDPLRIIRALRFKIDFGFTLSKDLESFIYSKDALELISKSDRERLRQELEKITKLSSSQFIFEINALPKNLVEELFKNIQIKLVPFT